MYSYTLDSKKSFNNLFYRSLIVLSNNFFIRISEGNKRQAVNKEIMKGVLGTWEVMIRTEVQERGKRIRVYWTQRSKYSLSQHFLIIEGASWQRQPGGHV